MAHSLVLIAGETSGDMHGALLAQRLRERMPHISLAGIGGERMRAAGVETFADFSSMAVVGFWEIIKHLRNYKKFFDQTLAYIAKQRPQAVVLIDFPGFNLRLAQRIRRDFPAIKIIYYISPQVWAWGAGRIALIKNVVDRMLVVFAFEEELYRRHGVPAVFVGHPLHEHLREAEETAAPLALAFSDGHPRIALLPGSREMEICRLLPVMLAAAQRLRATHPTLRFLLFKAPPVEQALLAAHLRRHGDLPLTIIDKHHYQYLKQCRFAWVCSGTATLETALVGTPLLIVYRTSFLTWFISRLLIKIPYIGLANIVAGEKIADEFVQFSATASNIARATENFLTSPSAEHIRAKLTGMRAKLGEKKASECAAEEILAVLKHTVP
ncbi:MAG: lipid-A-disaccharide synthase [Candidatus Omnitrophica bacterium]|nr:lipid-A-disaccharide synthase [Candidatus Omnitrophota bacterium]